MLPLAYPAPTPTTETAEGLAILALAIPVRQTTRNPGHMNHMLDNLVTTLEGAGHTVLRSTMGGIPSLEVSGLTDAVMSLDDAVRIAIRVNYAADGGAQFHSLRPSSVTLLVFERSKNYSPTQLQDYGVPVTDWVRAVLQLGPVKDDTAARVVTDARLPSETMAVGLIWSTREAFRSTDRTGKWCVVRPLSEVDALWHSVRQAVADGKLPAALVSTHGNACSHGGTFVICGFTRDWTDVAEAQAARELLRDLGVRDVISYKRDSDTNKGVYDADREFIYKA